MRYRAGDRLLLDAISLTVAAGEIHAILGPNGAGKSTLLRLLCGELRPEAGEVILAGTPLEAWPPLARAQRLGVLPQVESLRFGFTAGQVIALGRLPWGEVDRLGAIERAALRADIASLAERRYPDLSGGERARVQFARVCAQIDASGNNTGGRFLLLDEPAARLDPAQQHRLLGDLRRFAEEGVGVLFILHEPNHALRYADRCTLLAGGRVLMSGRTGEVLAPEPLRQLYGVDFGIGETAAGDRWIGVTGSGDR